MAFSNSNDLHPIINELLAAKILTPRQIKEMGSIQEATLINPIISKLLLSKIFTADEALGTYYAREILGLKPTSEFGSPYQDLAFECSIFFKENLLAVIEENPFMAERFSNSNLTNADILSLKKSVDCSALRKPTSDIVLNENDINDEFRGATSTRTVFFDAKQHAGGSTFNPGGNRLTRSC